MEGFEADDLIATYARIATEKGWHTTVISADKDLMQLMSDTVSIYDPMKHIMLTQDNVIKKFGVTADKMTDVQALMGDSVDNIPGATGIGPKGAADLINEFGSLEALLNNLDQVKNEKKRAILMRDKEQILISQQLVCLNSQAPVTQDLDAFAIKAPHIDKIESFIRENNFKSLINRPLSKSKKNVSRKNLSNSKPKIKLFDNIINSTRNTLFTDKSYSKTKLKTNEINPIYQTSSKPKNNKENIFRNNARRILRNQARNNLLSNCLTERASIDAARDVNNNPKEEEIKKSQAINQAIYSFAREIFE